MNMYHYFSNNYTWLYLYTNSFSPSYFLCKKRTIDLFYSEQFIFSFSIYFIKYAQISDWL